MSTNIADAFNLMLKMKARPMTIERPGVVAAQNIKIATSNYFRNMAAQEEVIIEGREFIVSKRDLDAIAFGRPKRGDVIYDIDLDANIVKEAREMIGFGGEIIGYRLRTA